MMIPKPSDPYDRWDSDEDASAMAEALERRQDVTEEELATMDEYEDEE